LERESNAAKSEPKSKRSVEALEAEIRRLRAENANFLEQREVLKNHWASSPKRRPEVCPNPTDEPVPYKAAWLCEALLVSRSGYYDWKKRTSKPGPRQMENMQLRQRIREPLSAVVRPNGSPRLAQMLGCPGRRNRMRVSWRAERIFARQRSKYRVATTGSRHGGRSRRTGFEFSRSNGLDQLGPPTPLVILTGQGCYILLPSGCSSPAALSAGPCTKSSMLSCHRRSADGLNQRRPGQSLIIHSIAVLSSPAPPTDKCSPKPSLPSMSRKGNCYDNAFIESFWSTLKYECVYHHRFATRDQAAPPSSITSRLL